MVTLKLSRLLLTHDLGDQYIYLPKILTYLRKKILTCLRTLVGCSASSCGRTKSILFGSWVLPRSPDGGGLALTGQSVSHPQHLAPLMAVLLSSSEGDQLALAGLQSPDTPGRSIPWQGSVWSFWSFSVPPWVNQLGWRTGLASNPKLETRLNETYLHTQNPKK